MIRHQTSVDIAWLLSPSLSLSPSVSFPFLSSLSPSLPFSFPPRLCNSLLYHSTLTHLHRVRKGRVWPPGHCPPANKVPLWCFVIPHFQTTPPSTAVRQRKNNHDSEATSSSQMRPAQQKPWDNFWPLAPSCWPGRGNTGTLLIGDTEQDSKGTLFAEHGPKPAFSIIQVKIEIWSFKNRQNSSNEYNQISSKLNLN